MSKDYKKLYEEALERARDLHDNHPLGQPQTWMTCEKIFPELKESDDERIRKSLAIFFAKFKQSDMWDSDFSFGDILAWLEKQGEQKSWSEEDEKYIAHIIAILEGWDREHLSSISSIVPKCIDWLKSIKPNNWKPSKEQMEALKEECFTF